MFSVGIFTTHLPYIAMVAFYAWFLIAGVNKTNDGEIQFADKSSTIQMHIDYTVETINAENQCFYLSFAERFETGLFEKARVKQKWKYFDLKIYTSQDFIENALFCRPPPELA